MKPINFKEATKTLSKPEGWTDDQCGPLPVASDGAVCVSCWQPTPKERLSILLFGKIWLYIYSGKTQPPVALLGERNVFRETA